MDGWNATHQCLIQLNSSTYDKIRDSISCPSSLSCDASCIFSFAADLILCLIPYPAWSSNRTTTICSPSAATCLHTTLPHKPTMPLPCYLLSPSLCKCMLHTQTWLGTKWLIGRLEDVHLWPLGPKVKPWAAQFSPVLAMLDKKYGKCNYVTCYDDVVVLRLTILHTSAQWGEHMGHCCLAMMHQPSWSTIFFLHLLSIFSLPPPPNAYAELSSSHPTSSNLAQFNKKKKKLIKLPPFCTRKSARFWLEEKTHFQND